MRYPATWLATLIAFVVLDLTWLATFAGAIFKSQLGSLLRQQPDLAPAVAFYLIYATGLVMLVVMPALAEGSLAKAIWRGAVLGLTAYATFDLTNLSIVQGWALPVSLLDMAWGTVASAAASAAGFVVASRVPHSPETT